jgi:DNA-binding Lrp family transcriptional regulator
MNSFLEAFEDNKKRKITLKWRRRDMSRAYVLFNVNSGSEDRLTKEVRTIPEVQEAFVSYGMYDLVVKIKTDSTEQLKELVSHRLRTIPDVRSTLTLVLVEE